MTTLHNIVLRLPDFEAKEKSAASNARITGSTPSDRGRRRRIKSTFTVSGHFESTSLARPLMSSAALQGPGFLPRARREIA